MAPGLDRRSELLDLQTKEFWFQQVIAGVLGGVGGGPVGALVGVAVFRKLEGNWRTWALIGVVAGPVLWILQSFVFIQVQQIRAEPGSDAAEPPAAQTISQADQVARACAEAIRHGQTAGEVIRNPMDGRELLCDPSYPTTVVVTSRHFNPLQQARECGAITLIPGTAAAQWMVSPAGTLICKAITGPSRWWWSQEAISRAEIYRGCTENLRLEARSGFRRTAHQLGRRDFCAEERALLASDRVREEP